MYYRSVPRKYHASSVYKNFDESTMSCFFSFNTKDGSPPQYLIIYEVEIEDSGDNIRDWARVLDRHNVYNFLDCYFDGKTIVVCDEEAVMTKTHFTDSGDNLRFIMIHKEEFEKLGYKTVPSSENRQGTIFKLQASIG